MWMRGGTSKGVFFLEDDLPKDKAERDRLLLKVMGSPDARQIDGIGGGDPLTSKVAIIKPSNRPGVDVDFLFLQVAVDKALVSDSQNCGNILAGVGPFAIERNIVVAAGDITSVKIYMENTGQVAIASVSTPGGKVCYNGQTRIDGVPGTSAPIPIEFQDIAGSSCQSLLPTGNAVDIIDDVRVTMIDNGMPCVIIRAADLGISGRECPEILDANQSLRSRLETIRLKCGPLMNLGDVTQKTVPKMALISRSCEGGAISTRTFIPHRCHKAIGVLAAVSVATACLIEKSCANALASCGEGSERSLSIEHPSGEMTIIVYLDENGEVERSAILRTAKKLMDGFVYV